MTPETLPQLFYQKVSKYGTTKTLFWEKKNDTWTKLTWQNVGDKVNQIAVALRSIGFKRSMFGSIFAYNTPNWQMIDLATQSLGGMIAPIYMNSTAKLAHYILEHTQAKFVYVDTKERLDKVLSVWKDLPSLEFVLTAPGLTGNTTDNVLSLNDFLEKHPADSEQIKSIVEQRNAGRADDLCTVVYTSGTTGPPKGVMLTHRNFVHVIHVAYEINEDVTDKDVTVSYLPLAHVAQRIADYVSIDRGLEIFFAESLEKLPENLKEIRPTVMVVVPRILEKIYQKVKAKVESGSSVAQWIFDFAENTALRFTEEKLHQGYPSYLTLVQWYIADFLVFQKLKAAMGGRLRFVVVGAAQLPEFIGKFFYGIGLPCYEVYGLSETTGPHTHGRADAVKFGTANKVIPHSEIRFDEDGEILVKGGNVFQGYYKNPEATEAAFEDGWFHTGDLGYLDEDGFLIVTGRKKELIVTSGGANVAPMPIEHGLREIPFVGQAMMVGDGRNYCTMLVTLSEPDARNHAESNGIAFKDLDDLANNPKIREVIQKKIDEINADLPSFSTIKKFTVLPHDFSVNSGELTQTMKLRRNKIVQIHKDAIEKMYAD